MNRVVDELETSIAEMVFGTVAADCGHQLWTTIDVAAATIDVAAVTIVVAAATIVVADATMVVAAVTIVVAAATMVVADATMVVAETSRKDWLPFCSFVHHESPATCNHLAWQDPR